MHKIEQWLEHIGVDGILKPASSDASFRSYYRLCDGEKSRIVMDASRQKESLAPFLDIYTRLKKAGVRIPEVFAEGVSEGYLLLEDMGNKHLFEHVTEENFASLYDKAMETIVIMQHANVEGLPAYDAAFLRFEMALMPEWYLTKKLGMTLSEKDEALLSQTLEHIVGEVLAQPQGFFVHRDFHSRNIMLTAQDDIVVIDFQDARSGAVTYDLVSLLRDCYIAFDPKSIEKLALCFRDKKGLDVDDATFLRWFDFTGLQRHIKVLGIFSRLHLRDGKEGYLKDIPLTLQYVLNTAKKYEETKALADFLEERTL